MSNKKYSHIFNEATFKLKVSIIAVLICSLLSFVVLEYESQNEHSKIDNIFDALWFMFASITTIGWGDLVATHSYSKITVIVAYILSRVAFVIVAMSAVSGMFGRRHLTVNDRLTVLENEMKLLRSTTENIGRNVNVAFKEYNIKNTKKCEYIVNSIDSLVDFSLSKMSKGAYIQANFSEEFFKSNAPSDYRTIIHLSRDLGVFTLAFTDDTYTFEYK